MFRYTWLAYTCVADPGSAASSMFRRTLLSTSGISSSSSLLMTGFPCFMPSRQGGRGLASAAAHGRRDDGGTQYFFTPEAKTSMDSVSTAPSAMQILFGSQYSGSTPRTLQTPYLVWTTKSPTSILNFDMVGSSRTRGAVYMQLLKLSDCATQIQQWHLCALRSSNPCAPEHGLGGKRHRA